MGAIRPVRTRVRNALTRYAPELYPSTPASALQPERLYGYLDALWQRRDLAGAVLEVGCWNGGTAAIAERMLHRTGHPKQYVCVDTFNGFVTQTTVTRLLQHYGAQVELVEGDIATVSDDRLPGKISVCLIDVDIDLSIYEGLRRVKPRLQPGGLVIVDCPTSSSRGGYERFVCEHGLTPEYAFGCGLVHG